ncbi:MAG: hypothetical protein QOH83_865, partial [Solirubrobacteraceae bacterium]|nr:hypothetical protein [Solirubrobacteraceae bacterium]
MSRCVFPVPRRPWKRDDAAGYTNRSAPLPRLRENARVLAWEVLFWLCVV